jgi:large subunit ribosomal protein L18e
MRQVHPAYHNKMMSKTKINRKMKKKTDSELAETIFKAKKNKEWLKIANIISGPTRNQASVNLKVIDDETKEGDTVVVTGKVLGSGAMSKKVRVVALKFSEEARKKLKAAKCEAVTIKDEVKVNPKAQGLKIIR